MNALDNQAEYFAALRHPDTRMESRDWDVGPDSDDDTDKDSGAYKVATLQPDDLIDHIDNLRHALERSCNRFYWLQLSALELARQAEQSLDYRPAFRKAIANVFLNGGEK